MRKPIRNLYLRIRPPDGAVEISAPRGMDEARIVGFVRRRRTWIDRQRTRMREQADRAARELTAREPEASGSPDAAGRPQVRTDARRRAAAAAIEAALPGLLDRWAPVVGRRPTRITLRLMTSRWGSCTPATGRIRLNLQLGLMEPRFLEYVLVHEMTHLWEHGHGAGFQRRMDRCLPDWRELRREINRYPILA